MSFRDQLVAAILDSLKPAVQNAVNTALGIGATAAAPAPVISTAKKAGRPKGSKNKPKAKAAKGGSYVLGKQGKPPAFVALHGGSKKLIEKYGKGAVLSVDAAGTLLVNGSAAAAQTAPVAAQESEKNGKAEVGQIAAPVATAARKASGPIVRKKARKA